MGKEEQKDKKTEIEQKKEEQKEDILVLLNTMKNNMILCKKVIDGKMRLNEKEENIQSKELLKAKEIGNGVISTQKEFIQSLEDWMDRITPKIVDHFKNWECWNYDDITDWIISLEQGRFANYENKIRTEMKTAELKGKHFKTLTENIAYLQRFGIVKFEEQFVVQQYLKDLIDGTIIKRLEAAKNRNMNISKKPPITSQKPLYSKPSNIIKNIKTKHLIQYQAKNRSPSPSPKPSTKITRKPPPIKSKNNEQYLPFSSFPIQKSPRIDTKQPKKYKISPQDKIRQIEHEYHEKQLQNILKERAKLDQLKKELEQHKTHKNDKKNDSEQPHPAQPQPPHANIADPDTVQID